ncbi:hypothetical protein [Microtetraspora malaysiensis]|uniref:hypothetical protein n=1 Tax=Microtetraspora malaysiensis TaxID=161358 RepID=UPI000A07B14A|nr:hypothetical protein [Microtetraspora malaysiensis]
MWLRLTPHVVPPDPQGVAEWSIGVLAPERGTLETTVLRFCWTIGLRGYPELRLALAREATTVRQQQPRE